MGLLSSHACLPARRRLVGCRHEPYDARSDCWSFGVLLVELLTQQKPYSALYATPVQVAIQVRAAVTLVAPSPTTSAPAGPHHRVLVHIT